MNAHVKAIADFHQEQREMLDSLDEAIEQARKERQKQADAFADWAMRRGKPNPKFDDEWKI